MPLRTYSVEQFAPVRPHQSDALNFHLTETLEEFDKAYRQFTDPSEADNFPAAREEFARGVAKCLAIMHFDNDSDPKRITTRTHFTTAAGTRFRVSSISTFGRPPPADAPRGAAQRPGVLPL